MWMNRYISITNPETLSEISRDIAQIFFGGLVVGSIIDRSFSPAMILSGFILSVIFWTTSLWLIRK
jgi:hypothetical protein